MCLTKALRSINTCGMGCPTKGWRMAVEIGGNWALTYIPLWAKASAITFEDMGTTDKVMVTRIAVHSR